MKILVTGAAGFIGYHTCLKLVSQGHQVYGIDNINSYYDPELKFDRLNELGFSKAETILFKNEVQSAKFKTLRFARIDLVDSESIDYLFKKEHFEVVCNLAAQAGVRYSIDNPKAYIDSNVSGFLNILEGCRNCKVQHLVFASSSSVYGENKKVPFETTDNVDYPISLYAATKKSNELMAFTYSHLYGIPVTGLRFFTVYGPMGRPDMAYFSFTKKILAGETINVFNNGDMKRDFTYIDDIIQGIILVMERPPARNNDFSTTKTVAAYKIYNIGNNQPVTLRRFISAIETATGKKAKENLLPMQAGDVPITYANLDELIADIGFKPSTSIEDGISKFVDWYCGYYKENY